MTHNFLKRMAPAIALAIGASLSGCNVSIDMSGFDGVPLGELDTSGDAPSGILLAGPDAVVITDGSEFAVTVDGDPDAVEAVRFDREGEALEIGRDTDVFDGRGSATIRVTMPAPKELGIAGSGKIEANTIASEAVIEIAGSGDVVVESVEAERLGIEIAGSGEVIASGTATNLDVEIFGSGDVKLANLTADTVSVEIAGSGNVEIASDGTVDAEIAGSGDIVVTGSATCSVDTAGSGSLTCKPAATADAAEADREEAAAE